MHPSPLRPTWLPFLIPPLLLCLLTDLLPTAASTPGRVGLLELAPVNNGSDGGTWQGPCFGFRCGRSLLALPGALLCMGEDWAWGCAVGVLLEKCSHWRVLHMRQWGSPANGFGKRPAAMCLAGRSTGMLATDIVAAV
ncbi:hypothetical protein B0H10DRAFT_1961015 [Mycena sp. CBHHK59/15]|nr:hypothetical protein B0H10DRAFT_1961015 [Mycena sp. CBHHK59/15]